MRLLAILLIVAMIAPDAGAAYSWYRSVTVSHAQVPNTDQASFPMLICANGSSPCDTSVSGLNQSGGGAKVQNSNGYDIGFFTDNACTTKVTAWEVERYTASTGEILIWVNDGTISHTSDTVLYLCYGDSGISTFQSTVANVWDSNYIMVTHGTTGGVGSVTNSKTGNTGRTRGDGNPAVTTGGPIGSYLDAPASASSFVAFDGVSGSEDIGLAGSSDFSMETWMNFSSADTSEFNFFLTPGSSPFGALFYGADNHLYWDAGGSSNGRIHTDYTSYYGNWTHIVLTSKGDDSFGAIYLNGSQILTRSVGQAPSSASDGLVFFYNVLSHASYDEIRFSKTTRSADWVAAEYNNQHSPSTFITFGTETAVGGGGASAASNRGLSINGGHLKVSGGHLRIQ